MTSGTAIEIRVAGNANISLPDSSISAVGIAYFVKSTGGHQSEPDDVLRERQQRGQLPMRVVVVAAKITLQEVRRQKSGARRGARPLRRADEARVQDRSCC